MDRTLLAALASPRRREILRLLWAGEQSVGTIHAAMPDVTMGAVSLQLKALRSAGLVEVRAEHKVRYYGVCRERVAPFAPLLEQMWNDALWALKLAAELAETRRGPRGERPVQRTGPADIRPANPVPPRTGPARAHQTGPAAHGPKGRRPR